jgi:hypothetical protein
MKTAILLFGMLREYELSTRDWQFDKHLNCDYYISTWNKSKQLINNFKIEYREYIVTKELLTQRFSNITCDILDEDLIFRLPTSTQAKMFFHWKNVYRLMVESNKKYDLIILVRPDCNVVIRSMGYVENDPNDNPIGNWEFDENTLYSDDLIKIRKTNVKQFANEPFHYLCNDLFFAGAPVIFDKFMNVLPDMNLGLNKYKVWTPHIDLGNMLHSADIWPHDIHPFYVYYPNRPTHAYKN